MITEDQIRTAFQAASPEVQAMVNSDDVFNAFHDIRRTHNLHIDHAGNLAQAINAVILEIVPFTELDTLLKEGMPGLDDATRTKVINDVNEKIFIPLRASVKKAVEANPVVLQAPRPTPPLPTVPPPPLEGPVPTPSVLEQKLASQTPPATPPTPAPPKPTPHYHGTDPYRELPE